jgi:hypothetical protein
MFRVRRVILHPPWSNPGYGPDQGTILFLLFTSYIIISNVPIQKLNKDDFHSGCYNCIRQLLSITIFHQRYISSCSFIERMPVLCYRRSALEPPNIWGNLLLEKNFRYRVSHETWQLVNSYESRLPYTLLDIKGFLQFIKLKISFSEIYFTFKPILP